MSGFTPTPEQQAIVAAARDTKDNLLVSALAGAAKTSTLVLIAQALKTSILCLAFNVRIKDEMEERMPSNTECKTLNGVGHGAWADYIGKRLTLDSKKTYRIVSDLINKITNKSEKEYAFGAMSDIMRNVDFGKACGYIPTGHYPQAKGLMDDSEFFAHLDEAPGQIEMEIIREATLISLREALQGTIDYADQLLMPTCWPANFPFYPVVLVDEAQDLSALNHQMLRKMAKKRLIAVGDPCQSIYGFRGAHQDSMGLLKDQFNMTELHLTISFRCPIAVVEAARWRAPTMQYPEWAKQGSVERIAAWDIDTVPLTETAVICRNNAPLFSCAIKFLRDGRYPELVGNDLGKSLIKMLRKLGPLETPRLEALALIEDWKQAKLLKARNPDRVHDTAACLRVFVEEGETLRDAIDYADRIMSVTGPVKLMTGHKSKGLEFETVFILDRDLIKTEVSDQEKNLLYVMQTRAKERLVYVDLKNYYSEKEIGNE